VLFVKGKRPATLTAMGQIYCEKARDILAGVDDLRRLGEGDSTSGEISIGFVPTTLQTLLPVVLAGLRDSYPELQINVRSGLSVELAQEVGGQSLDFALLTAPTAPDPNTRLTEVGREKLFLVASLEIEVPARALDLLRQAPYIAFARNTWLGGQIETSLLERGLLLRPAIELDSIDAIENLVAGGFGNSIVPQRLLAPPLGERMCCLPFTGPGAERRLMLASHRGSNRQTLRESIARLIAARAAGRAGYSDTAS
jgi:DNA-binding transcriptional LysR family regulator